MSAVVVILAAMAITWLGCLAYWINKFGSSDGDVFTGVIWGLLATMIFPVIWLGVIAVLIARGIKAVVR